jgi:hypothetical protein
MAITAQVSEQDRPLDEGAPSRAVRKPAGAWSQASQFQRSLPMLRLLTRIASIPEVVSIGVHVDAYGTCVRIVLPKKDKAVTARVYAAERDYLDSTSDHQFELHVSLLQFIPPARHDAVLAGFETILER